MSAATKDHKPTCHENRKENIEASLEQKEGERVKPTKRVLITRFCEKHNKGTDKHDITNGHDFFAEYFELGNYQCAEESANLLIEIDREK